MKKKPPIISSLVIIITLLTGVLVISGWFTNNDFLKFIAPTAFFVFLSGFFIFLVSFLFSLRNNITKSKHAEENIRTTQQEISDYKYALDESSIVAITDQKGIIKYANNNFCKISKYSVEELIGQDHRIINSGYHPKEFIRNLWVTIANGEIWKGELKNKAKDGTIYWVDTTIIPFLKEGKPYQYVAIRADITERKLVEENLRESLRETADYKYALDESSIVAITDQKGIIKYANNNFCKISRYSVKELIGKDHRIINSGHHPKEFIRNLWVTIANGKIWKGELKNKAKDGTIYWVDTTIVPFLNQEGKPYQYVAIRADITERKHAEENIKVTLKEISDYKYALDESSIVAITDQKGIIKYANNNFCKISKYSEEELIGQDHRIINSDYHPKEFIRNLWVTIANGEIWKGELKNKAKDGTIYWVDTTIVPFLNEEGKPYQYVAIRADITERKLVEENLRESLKETADYKYALDESSIVAITDQKGIIKYANNNFCKISKYSEEELIGKDHRIINSGYHPKEFIRNLWVTIANGEIWKGELKNKAKDGTIYWVDTTIVPFLDYKGKPYQYVAIRADITERKQAEDELIKSEKIYKTIASSIPGSVICLIDADYRYLLIEGDMLEKLGYSKNKLLGNKAVDVLPAEIFTGVPNEFKRVFEGETITSESSTHGYDIISRFIPLKDENDVVYSIMTVAIDVTELKNAQRDIIDLNRDLEEKITKRTEQLKKSNEELEAFSYSVSHDLRAPLRGIIGFTTMLEEDYGSKLDIEAKRITSVIKMNASKMGNLIDALLAFSRMGRVDIVKTNIDTGEMVKEVISELAPRAGGANIEWALDFLPAIKGDMNTMRQVWVNFISNAIKYSGRKENPRIQIGSFDQEGQTVFFVKDNGVGFDVQYSNKLFKVFQRLHSAEEFEGTGVGLALGGKIISKHGGKVWAEGEVNKGATFYFSLPESHAQPKHKSIMQ
jgi:PAS domain S-box-containing protein